MKVKSSLFIYQKALVEGHSARPCGHLSLLFV